MELFERFNSPPAGEYIAHGFLFSGRYPFPSLAQILAIKNPLGNSILYKIENSIFVSIKISYLKIFYKAICQQK